MTASEVLCPCRQPTPRQTEALAAVVRTGSGKEAASALGISLQTLRNHLSALYAVLSVESAMEAATALGWTHPPVDAPSGPAACGWVGYCSRPAGHRGHHGGMRAFARPHLFEVPA